MHQQNNSDFICPIKFCCGKLALKTLPSELRVHNARKPLILFSNKAVMNGVVDSVKCALNDSEMTAGIYDGVPESPTFETVRELSGLYVDNGHDAIIAVGSGAVMNVAKVVNIAVSGGENDVKACQGKDKINAPLNPFFVIPDGTSIGLMANGGAMIENISWSSRHLIPDYLVIDPAVVRPVRTDITADSAMRALAAACFAYTLTQTNYFIDPYAYLAIQTIQENLMPVIMGQDDKKGLKDYIIMSDTEKGRLALANASALGGFISYCLQPSVVARLSDALHEICKVPAGILAGILLPYGLEYAKVKYGHQLDRLLLALAGPDKYARTPETERSHAAMAMLRDMQDQLFHASEGTISRTLGGLGITENNLSQAAEQAAQDVSGLTAQDCLAILTHAHGGKPVSSI